MTGPLSEQIALVTGGSRGIGRAVCIKLASQGAVVLVNFTSNEQAAIETVRMCEEVGGSAVAVGFDVGDPAAVDAAIANILKTHNRIDILVNNAGIARDGLFIRTKNEDWDATMRVNLNGSFYCARAVARSMMKARKGRIVNISSIVGEMGNAGQSAYCSSKAGLIGLTKSLAQELASRNITVNAVTPGFIETDMTGTMTAEQKTEWVKRIPLERVGRPEDVAAAVGFLVSEDAGFITGQVMGVNGGMYM